MVQLGPVPDLSGAIDKCAGCPIRHRAVCSYSSPAELQKLESAKFYRNYDAGQVIAAEGEVTRSLGSVVTGVVALNRTLEDGRRQMVGLMFASDFIGRPLRRTVPFEASAVTDVRMCLFHRSQFEQILGDSPSLERRLLELTLDELDAARDWMLLLGRKTARERLASFLMILTIRQANLDKMTAQSGQVLALPLTREAIAEYLGLTIETVSRQFTALRKDGVIDLPDRRSVRIADLARLQSAAGLDQGDEQFHALS